MGGKPKSEEKKGFGLYGQRLSIHFSDSIWKNNMLKLKDWLHTRLRKIQNCDKF